MLNTVTCIGDKSLKGMTSKMNCFCAMYMLVPFDQYKLALLQWNKAGSTLMITHLRGGVNQNLFDRFRSDHFIEGRNCRHKVKRVFVFVLFFQEA